MAEAKRDNNHVPTLLGVSSDDGITPQLLEIDPITGRLLVTATITSGGTSGTEYTEGDTDASITGTAMLMEGAANTLLPVPGTTTDGLLVNLGANNDVTVTGSVGINAGTNAIGKLAANSGVDIGDVDVTSISAGTNNIGNVGVIPRTSGGMTIFRSIDIDETEEEIKASAGQIFSISAFNRTAAPLYLKFYNATAASTTVGTTTPVLTFVVPANADSDGAGFIWNNEIGFAFGTAISVACTTGIADADTGAPGANDCVINIGYA